jgi:hypothetical protein
MSPGRQDQNLASLKRETDKPGQPGSHVNQISKTYKNNIRGEISPLASQPGLPGQPASSQVFPVTNSPRLFTPGETKALVKSKVHQSSRALTNEWVVILTDPKNMADCLQEPNKQDFNFKRHIFGKSFHLQQA